MESKTPVASTEPGRILRRRPFHTCGASALSMAQKSYNKAQELNGKNGPIKTKVAQLSTVACTMAYILYPWLLFMSLADDAILAFEHIVESIFPPSTLAFDKLDQLLQITETVTIHFDDIVENLPLVIRQVPILDCALFYVVSWLNFLITKLTHWGSENTRVKEIMIDENSRSEATLQAEIVTKCHVELETDKVGEEHYGTIQIGELEVKLGSYKEALQNGRKEINNCKGVEAEKSGKVIKQQ